MSGKVVVNRSMSLDGFIAGPGHAMSGRRWPRLYRLVPSEVIAEVAAATGAMLVGRRTWDVGDEMEGAEPGSVDYPFTGPMFLLTHRPPSTPLEDGVTVLSGEITAAVGTALAAAGGKDLEILGADVAAQCLEARLVDEILVYLLPFIAGDGIRFSAPGLSPLELEPISSTEAGQVTMLRYRVRK